MPSYGPPGGNPRDTGEVAQRLEFPESRLLQQAAHGGRLVVAVLHREPPAGNQVLPGAGHDDAQRVEALASRYERLPRLEADVALPQVGIACGDIRRIADDRVEPRRAQRVEPVGAQPLDVRARRQHDRLCRG